MSQQKNSKNTRHHHRLEVKADLVKASDFLNHNVIFCCEQCSHFNGDDESCTIGYNTKNHLRENNLALYEATGRLAFCRYLEID